MKRLLTATIIALLVTLPALAQKRYGGQTTQTMVDSPGAVQSAGSVSVERPAAPAQQQSAGPIEAAPPAQAEFKAALAQADTARRDAEAAQARYETAQGRVQLAITRALAKLKLDPDDYDARLVDGLLVFVKKEKK